MANYIQPDFRTPTPTPLPTVQPHQAGAANGNPIALTWPIPRHVEKVSDKDDPQGSIRAGRSGH